MGLDKQREHAEVRDNRVSFNAHTHKQMFGDILPVINPSTIHENNNEDNHKVMEWVTGQYCQWIIRFMTVTRMTVSTHIVTDI